MQTGCMSNESRLCIFFFIFLAISGTAAVSTSVPSPADWWLQREAARGRRALGGSHRNNGFALCSGDSAHTQGPVPGQLSWSTREELTSQSPTADNFNWWFLFPPTGASHAVAAAEYSYSSVIEEPAQMLEELFLYIFYNSETLNEISEAYLILSNTMWGGNDCW